MDGKIPYVSDYPERVSSSSFNLLFADPFAARALLGSALNRSRHSRLNAKRFITRLVMTKKVSLPIRRELIWLKRT